METGTFIISLDFELFWGVRDSRSLASYGPNILGAREAIPSLLDLFDKYDVKATFATVGFLFHNGKDELMTSLPKKVPAYLQTQFSPYDGYLNGLGRNEEEDPYHYGSSLIKMISDRGKHEIATHTFSHYYCLEEGQTPEQFRDDLKAAKNTALNTGVEFKSIVFPRNQYTKAYLKVCKEEGLVAFRGHEDSWLYRSRNRGDESLFRRVARMIDSYVNISGFHVHHPEMVEGLCNIPSSRFLRPYNRKLSFLEGLRLKRIQKQVSVAAQTNRIFHLWWHPHNFGSRLKENLLFLEKILIHYKSLKEKNEFRSVTMFEAASEFSRHYKNESK